MSNIIAACIGVLGTVLAQIIARWGKRKFESRGASAQQTVTQTANPTIKSESSPRQQQSQIVRVGLDEAGVGRELSQRLAPMETMLAVIDAKIAPKSPPSTSTDPRERLAVDFFNQGNDLWNADDIEGASRKWIAATVLNPKNAPAHCNLGAALGRKGDIDGAIASFSKTIELDPNAALAHYNLGNALYKKGDVDGAIAAWHNVIDIDPQYAAHYNLGVALGKKGDIDESIASFSKAIELDPNDAAAHYNLAFYLSLRGYAKTNPAFDKIRNDPAFRRLVYGE